VLLSLLSFQVPEKSGLTGAAPANAHSKPARRIHLDIFNSRSSIFPFDGELQCVISF